MVVDVADRATDPLVPGAVPGGEAGAGQTGTGADRPRGAALQHQVGFCFATTHVLSPFFRSSHNHPYTPL